MPTLKQIDTRRKSVHSLQKVTEAMGRIARLTTVPSARRVDVTREFISSAQRALLGLAARLHSQTVSFWPTSGPTLHVVVFPWRGLCGGLPDNIRRFSLKHIQKEDRLYLMGKPLSYPKERIAEIYDGVIRHIPTYEEILPPLERIWDLVHSTPYGGLSVTYAHNVSPLRQDPTYTWMFPTKEEIATYDDFYDVSIDDRPALKNWIKRCLSGILYHAVADGFLSEQNARVVAMEGATDNAKELGSKLDLLYNRKRQEQVTNELIDIVTGANAQALGK